ncbi:Ornithine cyclodeaminase/mu-crystallin [Lasallia pustulata]|uniref:Ornithine cyclodeaminase/mu-crystallin n=1 Tax=Lasallia pustulata TaxID=136370 RepID=A0A1W5D7H7_9LECA|nr:Ornithine cyclodeaminase/mu-crystallin [Lasallia pustulata]
MPLTVLTDADVRTLLHSLTRDDIVTLQHNLAETLHEYSTGTQETTACCSTNQPQRISITGNNGQTTLFMPANTSTSTGVKIISLAAAPVPGSDSSSINSTFTPPPSLASSQSTTPTGSLTLLDSSGTPLGFINAEELTAFRTALASSLIFSRRSSVHSIAVFGAGKQAYWHIRVALLLRGPEIHYVNIINRSFARAQPLMEEIYTSDEWANVRSPKLKVTILSADYGEYARLCKEHVRSADVVFMTTPSTAPLFPAEYLTSTEGRRKGRYISAIGSYKPHMVELHPDILRHTVKPPHGHHFHKHADKGGVVVVDSIEACLKEAGEVIQAGLGPEQLVEVGELLMVKKAAMKDLEMGGEGEKGMKRWLEAGNVLYKSVGLGLMDLCVGEDIVDLARERKVGTTIEDF